MRAIHLRARRFSAFLIGAVFFLTGSLKLMDLVGTGLIVGEYLKFFHIGFLSPVSMFLGEILSLVETVAGVALMTGVFRKIAALTTAVLTAFFTIVTLLLWIFNPSMDCGCFGEAIHLTHFQSFFKNVILSLMCAFAFFPVREYGRPRKLKYITFSLVTACALALGIHSLIFIPLVDFTPFNSSSMLYSAVGDSTSSDDYISLVVYSKNGNEGAFTLDKLPDSTWTYVRTETMLKRDNIDETSYPSLSFTDREGNYCDSLASSGLAMVSSVYNADKLSESKWRRIAGFVSDAEASGVTPLVLVAASSPESLIPASLTEEEKSMLRSALYTSDYKTLISLNRSNGGVTYFNDGNLIEKWSFRTIPGKDEITRLYDKDAVEIMLSASTKGRLTFQAYLLYTFALMLIF